MSLPSMHSGWHQVAFERDLREGLNEVPLATRTIALARTGGLTRAFDAHCPHRGANLCRGGTLVGDAVICPFHGLRIALDPGAALAVEPFDCLVVGGLVFVKPATGVDNGFAARLTDLDHSHYFVPGFEMEIAAPAALVVENAFDALHFNVVHGIGNRPELAETDAAGGYAVTGSFRLPPSPWQGSSAVDVPYRATAFSPTVVLTELGGARPYMMLTATVPLGPRACITRLSLVLPERAGGGLPDPDECHYLLAGARRGLSEDQPIWEGLAETPRFAPVPGDDAVTGFRNFCERFE